MSRTYRDQYTGTNIEINIKTFHELRPDLKICWFTATLPGLQEKWALLHFRTPPFLLMILVQNFMLIKNHIETWV